MSAIFGLIHFDGSPVPAEDLARMQQALAYWGGDGGGLWRQGHVGLGCNIRQVTPESRYETFPITGAANSFRLTGTARLDNREELCRRLDIPQVEWCTTPDTRLLASAYERWGYDCPENLLGDWSLALWDEPQQQLFLARDHYGITGFYYYHDSRFLAFASAIKGLLALPQVPKKINPIRIAQILTSWWGDGVQTAYAGIFRLPPAHILTITGREIVKRRYWRVEDTPEMYLPREEDYLERFLELYQAAVNSRLRSLRPVGATLSGGLDSGSVCTLAARELRTQGKRLPVFSAIPLIPTEGLIARCRFGDESPYIEATARQAGNIDITYIPAADISPLEGIRRGLELHDEPGHAAGNYFWLNALLERVHQNGLGVLLTGQTGNATVSWTGGAVNLWALLGTGNWPALHREFQSLSGPEWIRDLWFLCRNQILKPLVEHGRYLGRRWQQRGREPWQDYAAINPNWARRLDLTRKMLTDGHDPSYKYNGNFLDHRLNIIMPDRAIGGHLWAELDAYYSMDVRDPTLDKRLMEFCLAIPNHCYYRQGQFRLLLRKSFADLMPPQVLWNRRKGLQAADIGYRVLKELSAVEAVMSQLESSSLGPEFLDLAKMRQVLASLQAGFTPENTHQCVTILLRGVMVGLFLLRFEGINNFSDPNLRYH